MTKIGVSQWRLWYIGHLEIGIYLEFGIWILEFNLAYDYWKEEKQNV
jgi:hypothetical protein